MIAADLNRDRRPDIVVGYVPAAGSCTSTMARESDFNINMNESTAEVIGDWLLRHACSPQDLVRRKKCGGSAGLPDLLYQLHC